MDEPMGIGAVVSYRYRSRMSWADDPNNGNTEYAMRNFDGEWEVNVAANTYWWDRLPAQPGSIVIISEGVVL